MGKETTGGTRSNTTGGARKGMETTQPAGRNNATGARRTKQTRRRRMEITNEGIGGATTSITSTGGINYFTMKEKRLQDDKKRMQDWQQDVNVDRP